jgi:hypothetical protein
VNSGANRLEEPHDFCASTQVTLIVPDKLSLEVRIAALKLHMHTQASSF